jgi:pyruvate-ferredoxin/flavodoxin oxidoreductase
LFRPFSVKHFLAALPKTVKSLAVLDRCKEPGGAGEPLYQDVLTGAGGTTDRRLAADAGLAARDRRPLRPVVQGIHPAMVKAVFDELKKDKPKNHFTVGIIDDVTHTSLDVRSPLHHRVGQGVRAMFYGLGADGTVGANKNSIKIIGEETDFFAQGYFVYDSKKSGSQTVSHLRFGPDPIRSTYLIQSANFIGCHQFNFLEKTDVLKLPPRLRVPAQQPVRRRPRVGPAARPAPSSRSWTRR